MILVFWDIEYDYDGYDEDEWMHYIEWDCHKD